MCLNLAIFLGKIISFISKRLSFGAGATWPGEAALRINPHILSSFASQFRKGIILVAGTNGKTTTASMIKTILEAQGLSVVHNASGANLTNGIVSACIGQANWLGKIDADWGVFEVDENSLPIVLAELKIQNSKFKTTTKNLKFIIVLLNLFRDQLDRYGEVDVIAQKWQRAFPRLDTGNQAIKPYQFIANADDPLVAHLGEAASSRPGLEARALYFGLNDPKRFVKAVDHATDSIFCLNCGGRLSYEGMYYSHIGIWYCTKCKEKRPIPDVSDWKSPLPGLYNQYNTLAAVLVAQTIGISDKKITESLVSFAPAFGRQEHIGNAYIFLSKNPTGFNQSLRTVLELGSKKLLLVLNDRIPDGRDVSWIWDVDFEMIPKDVSVRVSGDRVYDLALRLKYAGIKTTLYENLEDALATTGSFYVLPTYSAMLEVRKILKGKKIL